MYVCVYGRIKLLYFAAEARYDTNGAFFSFRKFILRESANHGIGTGQKRSIRIHSISTWMNDFQGFIRIDIDSRSIVSAGSLSRNALEDSLSSAWNVLCVASLSSTRVTIPNPFGVFMWM